MTVVKSQVEMNYDTGAEKNSLSKKLRVQVIYGFENIKTEPKLSKSFDFRHMKTPVKKRLPKTHLIIE